MSIPIDDETYGDADAPRDPAEVRNGNPGRPQSDYTSPEIEQDVAPIEEAPDRPKIEKDTP